MRPYLLLVTALLLSSCTSTPNYASPAAKELAATLSFVAGDTPLDSGAGIWSVGDYNFPRGPVTLAQIAPGSRNIGYNCPGFIFVDAPPTVLHKFQGGVQYELYCQRGQPVFRAKAP